MILVFAMFSSRTIGLNHIDLEHAREIGIQVCNAKYPPNGVAEFALMLLLMCMRNYKQLYGEDKSMIIL